MPHIDDIDRSILNCIQSDFPIAHRPYLEISHRLGLLEQDVIDRITRLKNEGIIRRIGGNFVPEKVGYVSTLCAAVVPEDQINLFAETVNRYPGVTHNYQRDHKFNVWFTFIETSMAAIEQNLEKISRETGVKDILNLPAIKVYKIRAHFNL